VRGPNLDVGIDEGPADEPLGPGPIAKGKARFDNDIAIKSDGEDVARGLVELFSYFARSKANRDFLLPRS
jgi:hypothetical protein